MLELLYPLLQGYDSVAMRADVEMAAPTRSSTCCRPRPPARLRPARAGGHHAADPRRHRRRGEDVEVAGQLRRRHRPAGGHVRQDDELPTRRWASGTSSCWGATRTPLGPRDAKRALAREIVARYHGEQAARRGGGALPARRREKQAPAEMGSSPLAGDPVHVPAVLAEAFGISRSEARRLWPRAGCASTTVLREHDLPREALDGRVLRAGKRCFVRLRRDVVSTGSRIRDIPGRFGAARRSPASKGSVPAVATLPSSSLHARCCGLSSEPRSIAL